ncbi:hypothetical protein BASA83_004712 [Batrachochytrium salamandrivorans]|nr:hypothetical protein BASA83_004712 [Batrachochytrium salamandrivorans]
MLCTFFVDCGADDIFMDSKLAEELKVPLTKLSNPITLRLADGDSSSTLTHRTVPLQLHIGKHDKLGVEGWFDFDSPTVWRTVRLGQLGLRDLENLQQSTKFCLQIQNQWNLAFRMLRTLEKMYFLVQYLRGL